MDAPYDCWNSHLIAGSPRKGRQEKKKTKLNNELSKGRLKCRNSADLVMLHVLNKERNKLKRPKTT